MMFLKGFWFSCLFLVTSALFAQPIVPIYSPSQLAIIHKRGYIRVGIFSQSYPPFIIYEPNGDLKGIDIELAREIGEILEVKVVFDKSARTYTDLMWNIFNKKDDIVLSAIVSIPSRARSAYFSTPYLRSQVGVLVNRVKYDTLQKDTLPSFNNSAVQLGVLKGSAYVGYIQTLYPKAQIVGYDSVTDLMSDVTSGKIDGCMLDDLFVKSWLAEEPERALRTRYLPLPGYYAAYGIATSYAYPIMGEWLNNFVQEAIFIGFFDRLMAKYTKVNQSHN